LVALTLPVAIGLVGFGIEMGLWYAIKRHNQTASDIAAISGAFELAAGQTTGLSANATYPDICALAKQDAVRNGFTFNACTCPKTTPNCSNPASGAMCANNPPALTVHDVNGNAITGARLNNMVEVILNQQQNTFFARQYLANVSIAARSVSEIQNATAPSCLLAVATTDKNGNPITDISIQGNVDLCLGSTNVAGNCVAPGTCPVAANSSSQDAIDFTGNSGNITAYTINTPGNLGGNHVNTTLVSPATVGGLSVTDPYASTLTHTFLTQTAGSAMPTAPACTYNNNTKVWPGNCVITPGGGVTLHSGDTLSANTQIAGGLTVPSVLNLVPGTYWITDGDLVFPNGGATLQCPTCDPTTGAGVTIILTTAKNQNGTVGALILGSKAVLNLNAPNSGTFKGLGIIQDSNGLPAGTTIDTSSTAKANATESLTGLVYFPQSSMDFQGGPNAAGPHCLILVVSTVSLAGNPDLDSTGCSNLGVPGLPQAKTITLTE
jgi:hypothetical protein